MLTMHPFSTLFLVILVTTSAVIDLRTQKIPNFITLPAMLIALTYHSALDGLNGLLFSLAGIAIGIALLIIPYLMGGMGAGDAKLMGAIGGVLGAKAVIYAFFLTAAVGGIYALLLITIYRANFQGFLRKQYDILVSFILMRKYIPDTETSNGIRPRLCYGLAIALGTGIYILLDSTGYGFFN